VKGWRGTRFSDKPPPAMGKAFSTGIPGYTDGIPMTEEMIAAGAKALRTFLGLDERCQGNVDTEARLAAQLAYSAMRKLDRTGTA
jgi:hypothetical protein